jgi:hypothetical protein
VFGIRGAELEDLSPEQFQSFHEIPTIVIRIGIGEGVIGFFDFLDAGFFIVVDRVHSIRFELIKLV